MLKYDLVVGFIGLGLTHQLQSPPQVHGAIEPFWVLVEDADSEVRLGAAASASRRRLLLPRLFLHQRVLLSGSCLVRSAQPWTARSRLPAWCFYRVTDDVCGPLSSSASHALYRLKTQVLLHSQFWLLRKAIVANGEEASLSFTLPIAEPLPPQYFVRLVSDKWLACEAVLPISFR